MNLGDRRLALCIALCLSPSCFWAADQADEIKEAFRTNTEALRTDSYAPILLDREWSLIADWVAAHLNSHPAATAKEVEAAIPQLDATLEGSVIELSPHTFVVAANRVEIGTFFIVSRDSTEYRSVWNVKDFAATHDGRDDGISHWSAHGESPLFGEVGALFGNENGNSRFYVDATYQGEGITVGKQLSIWEWNGAAAAPVLMGNYTYSLDSTEGVTFDGKLLRAHTKEDDFKTFFSCGGCPEPPGEWNIRITSDGVEDLGRRRLTPELDLIDNLYYRIQRRMPVSNMAAPDVIDELTDAIDDIRDDASVTNDYQPLGMLMDWAAEHQGKHMRICISTDDPGRYLFTLVRRSGKWFFTAAQDVSDESKFGKSCSDVMRSIR
jgi:GNAT superfamily N-acetyltransferase